MRWGKAALGATTSLLIAATGATGHELEPAGTVEATTEETPEDGAGAERPATNPPRRAPAAARTPEDMETLEVLGRRTRTATSELTIPAAHFELRGLESGGQMLEAVPNLLTAQHTGGGKAEQYFIRGFDADHGTDLAVYFDGVPINLRSHAHGQGFLDLHFVTKESIERLDAQKGTYAARYGDFATAAAIEYVPFESLDDSFAKFEGGSFQTLRAVGGLSSGGGVLEQDGPAQGYLTFEAYHTDGPFVNDEDLWRYSAFARGHVDLGPDVVLSGHLLGYYGEWNASGLVPSRLVDDGTIDRFGSIDPTEGGRSWRVQGKAQVDWETPAGGRLMSNFYVAWYELELYSNFTYNLENAPPGTDGIVQRDEGRIQLGGRTEYEHDWPELLGLQLLTGAEWRRDAMQVVLGTQDRRDDTGCQRGGATDPALPCNDDDVRQTSLEPYVDVRVTPLEWVTLDAGLRFAWHRFEGRDRNTGTDVSAVNDTLWLPKANLVLAPFAERGVAPLELRALRDLEVFGNFGIGYHSNDARAVLEDPGGPVLPRATGTEVGLRTLLTDRIELALGYWWLILEEELAFVGDEGTTEASGETRRQGIELVANIWLLDWLYLRGDVGYTSARSVESDTPLPQAPRLVAKAATGVRWEGLAVELSLRHLGDRYATEDDLDQKLPGYTVLDLGATYQWRFLELGVAVENLTNTDWSSSEFYYGSCTAPDDTAGRCTMGSGVGIDDRHFSPGNPIGARAWVTARF